MAYRKVNCSCLLLVLLKIVLISCQRVQLAPADPTHPLVTVYDNRTLSPAFNFRDARMDCSMPDLYIYQQTPAQLKNNTPYTLIISNTRRSTSLKISSEYSTFKPSLSASTCQNNCEVLVYNNCPVDSKYSINIVTIKLENITTFSYRVNCNNNYKSKPFQWGMFVLIFIVSLMITVSSMYSRAWSYGGYGIHVNLYFIIIANLLVLVLGILLSFQTKWILTVLKNIVGTAFGLFGVVVCTSQFLWVLKHPTINNKQVWKKIRVIDVISFLFGIILTIAYWVSDKNWVLNDLLSLAAVVATIKIIKVDSLKTGIYLHASLLVLELVFEFIMSLSLDETYNNLIVNNYECPLLVQFPSITPNLYRKCSWLPVTSLILPGIFLSYLRRFDISRSGYLYLLLGYISLYIGSILWMLIEVLTARSLPFAIISDPITILLILLFSYRRNQLKTLWNGYFFDSETEFKRDQLVKKGETAPQRYSELLKTISTPL